eukprot:jgi/Botrbrau1/21184/Bobra.0061s0075.1
MLTATGSAVTALFSLLSSTDGSSAAVTGSAAMGAINALKSLTANPDAVPTSAADQSVNAASSVASSAASSTSYILSTDDLSTILDLLGNAQNISSATGSERRRRLLLSDSSSSTSTAISSTTFESTISNVLLVAARSLGNSDPLVCVGSGQVAGIAVKGTLEGLGGTTLSFCSSETSDSSSATSGRRLLTVPTAINATAVPTVALPNADPCDVSDSSTTCVSSQYVTVTASYVTDASSYSSGLPSNLESAVIITGYVTVGLKNQTTNMALTTVPEGSLSVALPVLSSYVSTGKSAACLVMPTGTATWSTANIGTVSGGLLTCQTSYTGTILAVQYIGAPAPEASEPPTPTGASAPAPEGPPSSLTEAPAATVTSPPPPGATPNSSIGPLLVPAVSFTTHITTYNLDAFLKPQQDAYISALQAAAGPGTEVKITRIVAGSVIVTTQVYFLDGSTTKRDAFTSALNSNIASILPASTYGPVTVANVQASTVPNPYALRNALNDNKSRNIIIGCVVGIGGFAILVTVITVVLIRRRLRNAGLGTLGSPTNPDGRLPSQFTGPLVPPTPHAPGLTAPLVNSGGSL